MNNDIIVFVELLKFISESSSRHIPLAVDESLPFSCCPVCSCVKIDENTNFCPSCGQKLFYAGPDQEQELKLSGNLCYMCLNLDTESSGLSCSAGRFVCDKNVCLNFESK